MATMHFECAYATGDDGRVWWLQSRTADHRVAPWGRLYSSRDALLDAIEDKLGDTYGAEYATVEMPRVPTSRWSFAQ